jgi:hypothetical protein
MMFGTDANFLCCASGGEQPLVADVKPAKRSGSRGPCGSMTITRAATITGAAGQRRFQKIDPPLCSRATAVEQNVVANYDASGWFRMSRRKPPRRIAVERHSDNDKRRLREPPPDKDFRRSLAARVRFEGWGKHKLSPRAFGLEPAPSGEDDTYCDGHAGFSPRDLARIPALLQRGIWAGLIGHNDNQGDPTLIWTVDDNGWVYEGRITVPSQARYHGYPILPSDAFGKIVIARYTGWVYDQGDDDLVGTLQNALERYR